MEANLPSMSVTCCPLPTRTSLVPAVPPGESSPPLSRRRNPRARNSTLPSSRTTARRSRTSWSVSARMFSTFWTSLLSPRLRPASPRSFTTRCKSQFQSTVQTDGNGGSIINQFHKQTGRVTTTVIWPSLLLATSARSPLPPPTRPTR